MFSAKVCARTACDVVAGVEHLEVERPGGLGAPQPQGVDAAVAVAGDHVVVGDPEDVPAADPARCARRRRSSVTVSRVAAEPDLTADLRVRELPRVAELQPRVGLLDLLAVDEGLPEDAVLVADPVADAGIRMRRQRVDEAGGEPAEAAVAQARLDLLRAQRGQARCPAGLEASSAMSSRSEASSELSSCRPSRYSAERYATVLACICRFLRSVSSQRAISCWRTVRASA